VEKSKRTCGRGCTPWGGHKVIFLDQGKPPTIVDIRNRDTNIDKWTVVHEFGHAWDRNFGWSLSVELEQFTGGHTSPIGRLHKRGSGDCDPSDRLPGCNDYGYFYKGTPPKGSGYGFNRLEDFAESVTAYVYPDEAHVALMEFLNNAKISEPKYYKDYQRLFYYNDYTKTDRWQYINSIIK